MPHTAQKEVKRYCRKSADVDWYVRVGRKSMVQAEIIILCARTIHHCKTAPEEMTNLFRIYSSVIKQALK